ncbi:MAG: hypothetical protein K2H22_04440 [Muribaculaceae bacterium]|nr:hypothetical protein [Muribaculaceae bacterium]
MNTTKSILRLAVLFGLCALGLCLLFHKECFNDLTIFCLKVFFDKALGILCFFLLGFLYFKWCKTDKWLMKYEEWIKEAEQTRL